jgi:signal transduction histidine kinase
MEGFESAGAASSIGRSVSPFQSMLERFTSRGTTREADELILALDDVAAAMSSTVAVDSLLRTIVDRAKRITDTEKALLVLTDDGEHVLDMDTLTVRGMRKRLPQEGWEARFLHVGGRAVVTGEAVIDFDQEHGYWMLCSPIMVDENPIGVLAVLNSAERKFTAQQQRFLAILTAFAATTIENARLAEEHRYVLLASERDRIAREMHDGVVQSLFSISLGMEVCKKQILRDPDAGTVLPRLDELQGQLNHSMTELRRFIYDLRPKSLAELGLTGAIERWIKDITSGRTLVGTLEVEGEPRVLPGTTDACLYRVAKEAVSNVVRHADAGSFGVTLRYTPTSVSLTIVDDGRGFDVDEGTASNTGIGLRSMNDRVARCGGYLRIDSAPGQGTRIEVEV